MLLESVRYLPCSTSFAPILIRLTSRLRRNHRLIFADRARPKPASIRPTDNNQGLEHRSAACPNSGWTILEAIFAANTIPAVGKIVCGNKKRQHSRQCPLIYVGHQMSDGQHPNKSILHCCVPCSLPWTYALLYDCSSEIKYLFLSNPLANPTRPPSLPMTRCQGTMMDSLFLPLALPTARQAAGFPMAPASSL